jgi:hypothetical protein
MIFNKISNQKKLELVSQNNTKRFFFVFICLLSINMDWLKRNIFLHHIFL